MALSRRLLLKRSIFVAAAAVLAPATLAEAAEAPPRAIDVPSGAFALSFGGRSTAPIPLHPYPAEIVEAFSALTTPPLVTQNRDGSFAITFEGKR